MGAAIGVVPAIFTFGLSIPFCAVIGSGLGTAVGAAGGSAFGATLGGISGFGFTRRKEIGSFVGQTSCKAKEQAVVVGSFVNRTSSKVKAVVAGSSKVSKVKEQALGS